MLFGLNLLPQEGRFFDLIGESGELAFNSVSLLKHLIEAETPEQAHKLGRDIERTKHRSKVVTAELIESLCRTFVTPLDREDIQALAVGLYKIPKIAEKIQSRLLAFHVQSFNGDFDRLTHNMVEVAGHLQYLIQHLKSLRDTEKVYDQQSQINQIEMDTDDLLDDLLVMLFAEEHDVKQIIIRKDVYNLMESVVDRHRDMGNLILEIVLKNA